MFSTKIGSEHSSRSYLCPRIICKEIIQNQTPSSLCLVMLSLSIFLAGGVPLSLVVTLILTEVINA